MDYQVIVYAISFLLIGFLSTAISDLLSIGGIVRVPLLLMLFYLSGLDFSVAAAMAIGTSHAVSIPISLASARSLLREYRMWDSKDRGHISRFLKEWIPPLLAGAIMGLFLLHYIAGITLFFVYLIAGACIVLQKLLLRDDFEIVYRFPGKGIQGVVASITGLVSILSGISATLTSSVLKACAFSFESTHTSSFGGLLISILGTIGFIVSGLNVTSKQFWAIGYVDLVGAVMVVAGTFLYYRAGNKIGLRTQITKFRNDLAKSTNIDIQTSLHNRQFLQDRLSYSIAYADRFSEPFSVLMIDLDKATDLGDKVANKILPEVGILLLKSVRKIDIPGRYGGDEFIVILPRTEKQASITVAKRIQSTIAAQPFIVDGKEVAITVSIGICTYPQSAGDEATLIKNSEEAMEYSKRKGRNRATHYEDI